MLMLVTCVPPNNLVIEKGIGRCTGHQPLFEVGRQVSKKQYYSTMEEEYYNAIEEVHTHAVYAGVHLKEEGIFPPSLLLPPVKF